MTFAFSDAFFGEMSLGWGEQTSIDESIAPIEGVLLNADIIWLPTPMTMVEFLARSQVSTSSLVDSLGAIDRYYELSLQHAFWRYFVLGGYVSYEIADYAGSTLVDERVKEDATAEYFFNPYLSVYAATSTPTSSRRTGSAISIRTRSGSAWASGARARRSDELLDLGDDRVAQVRPVQREGDIGGEEPCLGAAVEGAAFVLHGVERLRLQQGQHGVRQLDLAASALLLRG
jgi:hypothetical protein